PTTKRLIHSSADLEFDKPPRLFDLEIGMSRAEVKFRNGEPERQDENRGYAIFAKKDYSGNTLSYMVVFADDRVRLVMFAAPKAASTDERIKGIKIGYDYDSLASILGEPSSTLTSTTGLSRRVLYARHGVLFDALGGEIVRMGIYDAALGTPEFPELDLLE